ncbi:hypothetical protein [Microbacterium memoriense]|uniref:Uncharacterized protein n=1 Tax=Microbacterium memoriense TaxID=2978350 RepID=A0ABT2PAZ8_9MICO|nr:hypothetical protein [Microbacterium memoriense]MCT9001660.1 hypothetical protein [Microbacterium memoriense]
MAAAFVVIPAFDGNANAVIIASVVLTIALVAAYRAKTGIKLSGSGMLPWIIILGGLTLVLALFSVALGLASFDLHWWIAAPAVVAFAAIAALTFVFTKVARERMRHVS